MALRPAGWLVVACAAVGLGGCYSRAAVTMAAPGGSATCYGDDHLLFDGDISVSDRKLCEAACHSFGFKTVRTTADEGGLSPRLNPGTPGACL